jgi:thiosulfate dehydrogenase (quinone) large subunit
VVEVAPTQAATGRCAPWPKDALRITFGIIWLIDATLKWLPGFPASYMSVITGEAQGQPGWLKPWFGFWIYFQHPSAMPLAYLVAIAETLIAVALIAGLARKITYLSAIVFSLLIWGTAEGFGGPYTSGASDIGTAIIYAVVFAALLALSAYAGPARYSADYYIEKKISWWWRVAEMRRPALAGAPAPARPPRWEPRHRPVPASTGQRVPSPSPPATYTWPRWPARRAARMRPSASAAWSTRPSSSPPEPRSASRSSTPTPAPPTAWSSPPATAGPRRCR